MSLAEHLNRAAARVERASMRIEAIKQEPHSLDNLREWLDALTELALGMSDVQRFNNESVHEKLHDLAARVGAKTFPGERARAQPE